MKLDFASRQDQLFFNLCEPETVWLLQSRDFKVFSMRSRYVQISFSNCMFYIKKQTNRFFKTLNLCLANSRDCKTHTAAREKIRGFLKDHSPRRKLSCILFYISVVYLEIATCSNWPLQVSYIKIQPDSEAYRKQTKEMNKCVIQLLLFVASKPHCQAEF